MLSGDFHEISLVRGTEIACGSAVSLAGLCNFAKKNGLTGLEFAWGIPASVGGALYMNAGAYGGEIEPSRFLGVLLAAFRGRGNAERSGSRLWISLQRVHGKRRRHYGGRVCPLAGRSEVHRPADGGVLYQAQRKAAAEPSQRGQRIQAGRKGILPVPSLNSAA